MENTQSAIVVNPQPQPVLYLDPARLHELSLAYDLEIVGLVFGRFMEEAARKVTPGDPSICVPCAAPDGDFWLALGCDPRRTLLATKLWCDLALLALEGGEAHHG